MMKLKIVLAALALAIPFAGSARAQDLGIGVGKKAPAAAVRTLDGKPVDLSAYIGKSPILIEFWAVWCPNCRHLEPAFMATEKKYRSRVKFIGLAVAINESVDRVKAYSQKHAFEHEILFDTDGNAAEAYDAPATSYVVVIDKAGKIVYTGLGGDQNLEAAIKKAL